MNAENGQERWAVESIHDVDDERFDALEKSRSNYVGVHAKVYTNHKDH
jgi:hypothetical protein